jgi:PAS domain S-box-containing protein
MAKRKMADRGRAGRSSNIAYRLRHDPIVPIRFEHGGLIEALHDVVFTLSPDGKITSLNPAFEKITGWPTEAWVGKPFAELVHAEDLPKALTVVQDILRGFIPPIHQLRIKTVHGDTVIGEFKSAPLVVQNRIVGVIGVGRDVTQLEARIVERTTTLTEANDELRKEIQRRTRVERQLRESEERYRLLVENARDYAIIMLDTSGHVRSWNVGAERMFGYREDEILGQHFGIFFPPEARRHGKPEEELQTASNTDEAVDEGWHVRRDGSSFWASGTTVALRDEEARVRGYAKIARDFTDRKRAEDDIRRSQEQFRVLIQNLQCGIALVDHNGRFTVYNPAFLRLFGLDNDEVLSVNDQARSRWQMFNEDETLLHADEHPVRRAVRTATPVRDQLIGVRNPGAAHCTWMLVSADPILRPDGTIDQIICTYYDITDRRRAEEALRESLARLKKVLDVGTVGVMFWDLSTGCLIDANDAFLTLMGYSRRELEACGLTWQKLTPPEYMEASLAEIKKFQKTERIGPYEKEYFRKDGSRVWLLMTGSSLGGNNCVEFCVDISERKRTEEALRISEARYRGLVESQQELIARVDTEGRFTYVNDAYCLMFGVTCDELIGKTNFTPLIYPDDLPQTLEALKELDHPPYRIMIDQRALTAQGVRWIEWEVVAIRDEEGHTIEFQAVGRDIHDRKLAEEALRRTEKRFRELADSMPQLVWTANPDGTVDYYNKRVAEYDGLVQQRPEGIWHWKQVLYPDDEARTVEAWNHSVVTGETYEVEHRLRMRDGSYRWHLSRAIPTRENGGEIVKWFGTATDIHDLRFAQEELRHNREQVSNVISSAMDAIISIDESQRVVLFNASAEKLFGVRAGDAIGRTIDQFIPERFRTAHRSHIDHFGAAHVTKRSMGSLGAIFGVRSNGEEFPIEASISQATVGGRKLYTVILRDITERVQAEEEIKASLREKEVLLKEVHHRVKNNLQVISSLLRLQAQNLPVKELGEPFKESLNRIQAMALVHEKLYQSKDLANVPFGDYIRSVTVQLQRTYGVSPDRVKLQFEIPEIYLSIDAANACGLIVNELVSNALKYAFPGGRNGKIIIRLSPMEHNRYELVVRDNGVGLPVGLHPQSSPTLGLQLVHVLADELSGHVSIRSRGGTEVAIIFREPKYRARR